ncbi:MAG: hypothetical protein RB296_06280 [Acidobacteriota bacterium]|nr:hypothetical protein [Acidobacteriota bacterium]
MMKRLLITMVICLSAGLVVFPSGKVCVMQMGSALMESATPVLLLCNGHEEMICGCFPWGGFRADAALIFLPLPSSPVIATYDPEQARILKELLAVKSIRFSEEPSKGEPVADRLLPSGDVSAVSAMTARTSTLKNWQEFVLQAGRILEKEGLSLPETDSHLKLVVEEHIASGRNNFVFFLLKNNNQDGSNRVFMVRFSTDKLFFPMKRCAPGNSENKLMLYMILPGSLGFLRNRQDLDSFSDDGWDLSSSAKLYPGYIEKQHMQWFFKTGRTPVFYLQVARYRGSSALRSDLLLEVRTLASLAYAPELFTANSTFFPEDLFSIGELLDMKTAISSNKTTGLYFIPEGPLTLDIPGHSGIKADCLRASLRALELEIANLDAKIKAAREGPGDPANIGHFQRKRSELLSELKVLLELRVHSYRLPDNKTLRIRVDRPLEENGLLHTHGGSRSGPFYHIAGMRNDSYSLLTMGKNYQLTAYMVRQRDYPFPDFYVYIADWRKI